MSKTAVFPLSRDTHLAPSARGGLSSLTVPACARVVALVSAFGFVAACVFGAI